jgi:hypothetical protein
VCAYVQDDVLDTVRGHFDQFSKAFACVNALRGKVIAVESQLAELHRTADVALASSDGSEHVAVLEGRLTAFRRVLVWLRALAEVDTRTAASLFVHSAIAVCVCV